MKENEHVANDLFIFSSCQESTSARSQSLVHYSFKMRMSPQAQWYFKQRPSSAWSAYVAGALLVLMRECGVRPSQGIALLVFSEVPEGKGVSSSAAVEVASFKALAFAHGLHLEGRQLALLCQKVENLVVGELWWLSQYESSEFKSISDGSKIDYVENACFMI